MAKRKEGDKIAADDLVSSAVTVYRSDKSPITISGSAISFIVVDGGTLVIQNNGNSVYAFAPGEWMTVNTVPV